MQNGKERCCEVNITTDAFHAVEIEKELLTNKLAYECQTYQAVTIREFKSDGHVDKINMNIKTIDSLLSKVVETIRSFDNLTGDDAYSINIYYRDLCGDERTLDKINLGDNYE